MNVFTYGSLMFADVWNAVVRGYYSGSVGRIKGFVRRRVKNETYPALIHSASNDVLQGYIYFNVSKLDLNRLDRFEGDYYQREIVKVALEEGASTNAAVYVFKDEHAGLVDEEPWDVNWFEREGLAMFLRAYKGFLKN